MGNKHINLLKHANMKWNIISKTNTEFVQFRTVLKSVFGKATCMIQPIYDEKLSHLLKYLIIFFFLLIMEDYLVKR